jgi:serine phosphatase RsbU (regulator of sigma subunit)
VLKQKQLVETKNQQITASITYAKHIQDSFLLSEDALNKLIPYESFVFFQPKDIVSGDFYWFSSMIQNGNPVYVVVAADCTGHGVPGAFMSMMGSMLLNKIVNENNLTDPSKILMEIHHGIFNSLHREDVSSVSQDGMDVSICTIDPAAKKITYAGAMNPLYIMRHPAGKEAVLEEIKPSVFSLGDKIWNTNSPIEVAFQNHEIPFEKNMSIYLFSDGYIDQYHQDGKHRYGSQRFKKLLTDSAALTLKEQKDLLIKEHETWRGGIKQLDDVLVIGIRL